ncbi:MAG: hypothetical protein JXN62_04225, partial [Bacteroidales bacterium]|nr:hypothetical protein [Bacteroidales bacterium]
QCTSTILKRSMTGGFTFMYDDESIEHEEELEDISDFDERANSDDVMSFEEVRNLLGFLEQSEE